MANSNVKPAICVPAMLYLVLSVIALISMAFNNCMGMCLLFKVLFVAVWTWFLNFLCTKGYTTISWILVLLPFIMFILMILLAYEVFKRVKDSKEHFEQDNCIKDCMMGNTKEVCDEVCNNPNALINEDGELIIPP